MVLGIDILHSTGSLKHGLVDGHAVRGHAERELVVSAGGILAGGLNAGADVGLLVVGPQVAQIGHQALGAPVGNQTLGSFHDDVRCAAALDSGVDLVVAVGVVEVLDGDVDVRILGIEVCQQRINGRGIAPLADGVGPQRNVSSLTGIGGGLRGSGLAGGGRGALSRRGRGRCAGSGAAAGDEHAAAMLAARIAETCFFIGCSPFLPFGLCGASSFCVPRDVSILENFFHFVQR